MGRNIVVAAKNDGLSRADKTAIVESVVADCMTMLPFQRDIEIVYKNHPSDFANISTEGRYFRAEVMVDIDRHNTRRELAGSAFHEMMHLLIEPLATQAERLAKVSQDPKVHKKNVADAIEAATSAIEKMFFPTVFPEYNEE